MSLFICFKIEGFPPSGIAENLVNRNILIWNGDFYQFKVIKRLRWMKKADHCVEVLYFIITQWKLIYYFLFWKSLWERIIGIIILYICN